MKTLITLILTISLTTMLNAKWFWQNSLPTSNDLSFISFTDDQTGWDAEYITNGGNKWITQSTGNRNDLESVSIIDSKNIPTNNYIISVSNIIKPTENTIFFSDTLNHYEKNRFIPDFTQETLFPLELNNTYQYLVLTWRNGLDKYSLDTIRILEDTIINNSKFYKFTNQPYFYNYNINSNNSYIFYNGNYGLHCDFNLTTGDSFYQFNPYYNNFRPVSVVVDSVTIFNEIRKSYEWSYETIYRGESIKYAKDIGIIRKRFESYIMHSGGVSNQLINAIIYDSLGNKIYFSHNRVPEIIHSVLDTVFINCNKNFLVKVKHYYNRFNIEGPTITDGVIYLDSVFVEYFNPLNQLVTLNKIVGERTPATDNYFFTISPDSINFKNGDTLFYRIVAKDKALIPSYFYLPEQGYYKVLVHDFLSNLDDEILKLNFSLYQNYPNPFNPVTKIKFSIPQTDSPLPGGARGGFTTLKIYNILGNKVATLVNEPKAPGIYEVEWNAEGFSSGVYFYRLISGSFTETKKMILLR